MGVVGGMKLDGRSGVALEFEGGWFGRIRAQVMVATDGIASRGVRNGSDGFGGEGKPEEAGSGHWRGVGRGSKLAGVGALVHRLWQSELDLEDVAR